MGCTMRVQAVWGAMKRRRREARAAEVLPRRTQVPPRQGRALFVVAVAIVTAVMPAEVGAQEDDLAEERVRGEWAVFAGVARGRILGTRGSTTVVQGLLRYGVDLGRERKVSLLFEAAPFVRVEYGEGNDAQGGSLTSLLRYNFVRQGRWRAGFLAGVGAVITDTELPEGTSRLNFSPQVGAALQRRITSDFGIAVEYRFIHISNASLAERNPGLNSHAGMLGLVWRR